MSEEAKKVLLKRFYSYMWRVGMFAAVGGVAYVTDILPLLSVPAWGLTLISLALSEVTKYLNTQKDPNI